MDKVKSFLSSMKSAALGTNIAMIAFVAYTAKILALGQPTYPDALVLLIVATIYGFQMHLKSKKPDPVKVNEEVQSQIAEIHRQIKQTQMEQNVGKKPKKFF